MNYKLLIVFYCISSTISCAQFTNSSMHFSGNYKPQSRWGVFMMVGPERMFQEVYPHVAIKALSSSKTGYQLNTNIFKDNPDMADLFPYDATDLKNSPMLNNQKDCTPDNAMSPVAGVPAGKCKTYTFDINPDVFINNLTPEYDMLTFAMFPCDAYGTTFQATWDKPYSASTSSCKNGFYDSYDGGKTKVGWYRYDYTFYANPYMRYAAAQMMKKETGKQNYLTIADVNSVGQTLFGTLDFTVYFNTVFMLYFSNAPLDAKTITVLTNGSW